MVLRDHLHHGKMQLVLKADQCELAVIFVHKGLFLPETFQLAVHYNQAQTYVCPEGSFFFNHIRKMLSAFNNV